MHASAFSLVVFAAGALAQSAPYLDGTWHQTVPDLINCGPDVIVDNFTTPHTGILPLQGETAVRDLDQLGGDYGKSAAGMNVSISTDGATLKPTTGDAFFFFKFDAGACYDLSNINALAFDVIAPAGGSFDIGLTQKSADCHERVGGESGSSDSPYVPLSKYITPDGNKHTVVMPFQDVKGNGSYDFAHVKDLTMINWKPAGSTFVISNIRLRRACNGNGPSGTNTTVSTGSDPNAMVEAPKKPATGTTPAGTSSAAGPAETNAAGQAIAAPGSGASHTAAASGFAVLAVVVGALSLI